MYTLSKCFHKIYFNPTFYSLANYKFSKSREQRVWLRKLTADPWRYADKEQLSNSDLKKSIEELCSNDEDPPFIILDVRETHEHDIADIPLKNNYGVSIPRMNMELNDIIKHEFENKLPKNKSIICVCDVGLRSAKATTILKMSGYSVKHLCGGLDSLSDIMEGINKKGTIDN